MAPCFRLLRHFLKYFAVLCHLMMRDDEEPHSSAAIKIENRKKKRRTEHETATVERVAVDQAIAQREREMSKGHAKSVVGQNRTENLVMSTTALGDGLNKKAKAVHWSIQCQFEFSSGGSSPRPSSPTTMDSTARRHPNRRLMKNPHKVMPQVTFCQSSVRFPILFIGAEANEILIHFYWRRINKSPGAMPLTSFLFLSSLWRRWWRRWATFASAPSAAGAPRAYRP